MGKRKRAAYTQGPWMVRAEAKIDKVSSEHGCWLWTACTNNGGPKLVRTNTDPVGQTSSVRRALYEEQYGPLDDDYVVQACPHDKDCVNPAHMAVGPGARRPQDISERFDSHVTKAGPDECWLWDCMTDMGPTHRRRAARFSMPSLGPGMRRGRTVSAQRYAYEREYGPIPETHRVRACPERDDCVNPAHLSTLCRKNCGGTPRQ